MVNCKALRWIIGGALLALSVSIHAETISGRVVSVADGDTLSLLDANHQTFKIRLVAIDAPQKNQAFGNRAKQVLSTHCFDKEAEATIETIERYGRYVAEVYCEGINANEILLSEGMAWVYTQYAKKFPHYIDLENEARLKRIGLWADANPVSPWEFRNKKR